MIDEFKKQSVMEKLGEDYDSIFKRVENYTRTREEPRNSHSLPVANNELLALAGDYHQGGAYQVFITQKEALAKERQEQVQLYRDISAQIFHQDKKFQFSGERVYPPPAKAKPDQEEGSKSFNAFVSNRRLSNKIDGGMYDFDKIIEAMRVLKEEEEREREKEKDGGVVDDIPLLMNMKDINVINEFKEVQKMFTYSFNQTTLEAQLKKKGLYEMSERRSSIMLGTRNVAMVNFARDLTVLRGSTGNIDNPEDKHPFDSWRRLAVDQLDIDIHHLRYGDLMNIVAGRLTAETPLLSLGNKDHVKKELQVHRSTLKKMEKRLPKLNDQSAQCEAMGYFAGTLDNEQEDQNLNTGRLVDRIQSLKQQFSKKHGHVDNSVLALLSASLNELICKVIPFQDIPNPSELKQNMELYLGNTDPSSSGGFERRRLVWFYLDCVEKMKVISKQENIRHLIEDSLGKSPIKRTVIKQKLHHKNISSSSITHKASVSNTPSIPKNPFTTQKRIPAFGRSPIRKH